MKKKRSPRSLRPSSLHESEIRYRRLFEAAQDGILILDAGTGRITDVNPFLVKLLGLSHEKLLGKKLWEIGLFRDVEKSRSAFRELQRNGYIRYEDLPLETKDGRYIDVEFVSNIYQAGGIKVIQCNIRDITERKHAEVEKAILATVEEEQRRIGQDLHDGLCQQLAGVALIAKALGQKLSASAPDESADAHEIAELINQSITQTRDLARGLSPVEIEVAGLTSALQKLAATTERLYKISCVFKHEENGRFRYRYGPLLATHLYRIVQEAVGNAIQHGKAKRVVIGLAAAQDRGLLTIKDNGIGFAAQHAKKSGLGLRSMRYRATMIGARLKIGHMRGGGTSISCSFPHKQTVVSEK
jgi:PAS domain S-box-containing protein